MNYETSVITWNDAKKITPHCDPAFIDIVDSVKGSADFKLIKAQYPYMTPVVSKGNLGLCVNEALKKYNDPSINPKIRKLLDYPWRGIPMAIVSQGSIAPQTIALSHTVPFGIFMPNALFALLGALDTAIPSHFLQSAYSLISGCESILLLPPVSDKQKNEQLQKEFQLSKIIYPQAFSEQTQLIKALIQSESFKTKWLSEILIFSKDFFSADKKDMFIEQLALYTWNKTGYMRYQHLYQVLWSVFIEKFVQNDMGSLYKRSASHIVSVVKHLVDIVMRQMSGFSPAIDNVSAPISDLIDAYIDVYKIRFFHPTIMTISQYNGIEPVYYSMHRHTFLNPLPELATNHYTIDELITIREVLCRFQDVILSNDGGLGLEFEDTLLYHMLEKTEFKFYHPKAKKNSAICTDIDSIFDEDLRFSKVHRVSSEPQLKRPTTSLFFKGCIRINPWKKGVES